MKEAEYEISTEGHNEFEKNLKRASVWTQSRTLICCV